MKRRPLVHWGWIGRGVGLAFLALLALGVLHILWQVARSLWGDAAAGN